MGASIAERMFKGREHSRRLHDKQNDFHFLFHSLCFSLFISLPLCLSIAFLFFLSLNISLSPARFHVFASICMQQAIQPHSICISMLLDIPLILLLRLKSYRFVRELYTPSPNLSFDLPFPFPLGSRVCLARKIFAWKLLGKFSSRGMRKKRRHCFNFKQRKRLCIFAIGGHRELKNKGRKIAKVRG